MRKSFLSLIVLMLSGWFALPSSAQGALPQVVNTTYDELYPVVNMQGDALYFARFRHPSNRGEQNASDVWATYKSVDGYWSKPVNIGAPVNSSAAEWPLSLNTSGKELLLYKAAEKELRHFKRAGRSWNASATHDVEGGYASAPAAFFQIAQDGHHLISALPQQGHPTHKDLFISTRTGAATWSRPQPLPQAVNSLSDEQSVYLAPDNRTLYFASNRAGGTGGYDLYLTRRKGEGWRTWSAPVNLGPAVNTNADELFITIPAAGTPAFIARRPVGSNVDVLEVGLPKALQPAAMKLVTGKVKINRESLAGEAEVRLEDPDAGRVVRVSAVASDGTYSLLLPAEERWVVYAELPGYFPVAQPMERSEGQPFVNATVSVGQSPGFAQQETGIRSLHLHLEQLDSELVQLKEERQRALNAVRSQNHDLDLPSPSDPEIEALRHRYRYFTEVAAGRDTLPDDGYDEAAASERELEDMQARFKRYYVHEKAIQEADQELKEGDRHLWEKQQTFEALQAQAREELEVELIPEVEKRLIQGMEVPVEVSPSPVLSASERETLEQSAMELQSQIKKGLAASNDSSKDWTAKGGFRKPQDEPEEWEAEVLEGLKTAMHDDVAEALAPKLEEKVSDLVEIDAQYQVKKLERSMVQQKLDRQVARQLAEEAPSVYDKTSDTDEVAPLVPPASARPSDYEEVEQDLLLVPAEVGRNIPLNSVQFENGTDRLLPSAYPELNRLLAFLNQHPALVVEVGAHAGAAVSYAKALELTQQRGAVVRNFLIGNGIDGKRLKSKGYGKAFPKSEPAFSERLEIRIIGKN